MTDFLNRIHLSSLYSDDEWKSIVTQARYNITTNTKLVSECFYNYDNLSDEDMVIINRLMIRLLLNEKITDLYLADDWNVLADNLILIENTKNMLDPTNLVIVKDLYKNDDHWNKSVATAKNIMSKVPPPHFVEKWPLLGSEAFRERMKESDENSVITMNLAMALSKGQKIAIYHTDDWELLQEMVKYS